MATVYSVAQEATPLTDFAIKVWSNSEGIPSNNLTHVVTDSRGYLWISTFNGAVRFDGNSFKSFDTDNIKTLTTSAVRFILPLPDGTMYLATESSGLLYYANGVFSEPYKNSILPKSILTLYAAGGRLWIGSAHSGLFYIQNKQVHKFNMGSYNEMPINAIEQDDSGILWIGSSSYGLFKIEGETFSKITVSSSIATAKVFALSCFQGNLYVGKLGGLSVFDNRDGWQEDKRFTGFDIFDIKQDTLGNLWIGGTKGLARITASKKFELLNEYNGLPARTINGIEIDHDYNIWLATYRGGLVQLKATRFKNFTRQVGLTANNINIITPARGGGVYIGSDRGTIDKVKDGTITKVRLPAVMDYSRVKDIYEDSLGVMWVATYDGLFKLQKDGYWLYTTNDGLLSNLIRVIMPNPNGDIWIGSRTGGINIIKPSGEIKTLAKKDGLSSDFIFSLQMLPNGSVLASTSHGGLNIISPKEKVVVLNPDNLFDGVSIFNVWVENESSFWLATNVGLYHYNGVSFFLIDTSKGLLAETIFDIVNSDDDRMWLTTIKGVVVVKKSKLEQLIAGKVNVVSSILLNESDGMASRECTGATRSYIDNYGKIWIPTIKGAVVLDSHKPLQSHVKPPVAFIENMIIDDTPVDPYSMGYLPEEVIVEPGFRNYEFEFTNLHMGIAKKVQFMYMLEGFDSKWNNAGVMRHAKYTNLPYGSYTFKVKAGSGYESWTEKPTELKFYVTPYFYETTTFKVLVIVSFLMLIYLVYMYRTKNIKLRNRELTKLNAELDSFAYRVSHDLKAPLASIQGLLNIARLEHISQAPFYFDKIETSVSKLDAFIKDIISYSKNARLEVNFEKVNLKKLINEIVNGLAYDEKYSFISFRLDASTDLVVNTDKTRLTFILNNLLSNAFKFADKEKANPFVLVKVLKNNEHLQLIIEDNGLGIPKAFQKDVYKMFYRANEKSDGTGLGLYIVKESVDKLKGKINLVSEEGKFTRFQINLPFN